DVPKADWSSSETYSVSTGLANAGGLAGWRAGWLAGWLAGWRAGGISFTAKAEQTYFAIRGGKAKRVDAASVVEAASVCGGK
ncbi:hypothetical protein DPMN_003514, partial [Dreissena polymorpha]